MMAYITTSTVYSTILVTTLLLLSKGWLIIRNTLTKEDVSALTIIMGATYLCNSAYYVSINAPSMQGTVTLILNSLNIVLFIIVLKNCAEVRNFLKL
jgi:hypothetical protein